MQESPQLSEPDTFDIEIERYIDERLEQKKISDSFSRTRKATLLAFRKEFHIKNPSRVTQKDVQNYYDSLKERGMKENTAQGYIFSLRAFFNWLKDRRKISINPANQIEMGRIVRHYKHGFCSKEEVELLLQPIHRKEGVEDYIPKKEVLFVLYCGFDAGMRRNEISEAISAWFQTPGIVHLHNSEEYEFKDGDDRFIPLTNRFAEFLKNYGMPTPYMLAPWKTEKGVGRYRYDFRRPFEDHIAKVSEMSGKDLSWVTIQTMRHTFASLRIQKGANIYKVAKWLGDGVQVVENHYGHLAPNYDGDIEL